MTQPVVESTQNAEPSTEINDESDEDHLPHVPRREVTEDMIDPEPKRQKKKPSEPAQDDMEGHNAVSYTHLTLPTILLV